MIQREAPFVCSGASFETRRLRRRPQDEGGRELPGFFRVPDGDYASTSEVIRAALRDWKMKRALQLQELAALKTDIDKGLADVAAGRVKDFDAASIIERGRKLLAARSSSV